MRIFLILAGLILSLAAASQEIWRWVDKNGIVHYSDQPDSPDAKLIDVIEPNAYEGEAATPASGASGSGSAEEDSEPSDTPYDSLSIVQPEPDQVFFGSDATVSVEAELGGTLQSDHSVVFFLNGNRRPASGLGMELSGLARGTYNLRASVLNESGKPVITSAQTTFHVRQASTQNPQTPVPARPQLPRPRPTPLPTPRPATPPANTPRN